MSIEYEPNLKIGKTVAAASVAVLGNIGAESYGVVSESMAHAVSLGMLNASAEQFAGSQLADAAVAKACAEILKAGQ